MWKKLLLFDIDGTLVSIGHSAHTRSFDLAVEKVAGKRISVLAADPYGRTDTGICLNMLALAGMSGKDGERALPRVFEEMVNYYVEHEIDLRAHVIAGARKTLEALGAKGDYLLGLLTGNHESIGWHKLRKADLDAYFSLGSFGNESGERNDLVAIACARAKNLYGWEFAGSDVVVIGDTPRDIECGRSNGALTVAVTTGNFSAERLRAENPDLLLGSLAETEPLLEFLART